MKISKVSHLTPATAARRGGLRGWPRTLRRISRPLAIAAIGAASVGLLLPGPSVSAAGPLSGRTIVLNAEEGGSETGAIAGGVDEKNINLPITLDLGALLKQEGAHVVFTRTTDVGLSLQSRAALANQVHADAMLTVAANAMSNPGFSGLTTYYGSPGGYTDRHTRPADLVAASRNLAQDVQQAVLGATGEVNRGVQASDFYVIGYANMPSILIETGFMTNPPELARLVTPSYQHTVAAGIASGLEQFLQGQPENSQPSTQPASIPWVQTFLPTALLSGADPGSKEFALLPPFSFLKQIGQAGDYLLVQNPATDGPGYVAANHVGPSGPPPPTEPAFKPFWVESFRATRLWSGPDSHAIAFGPLRAWNFLEVVAPSSSSRFLVRAAATGRVSYVDRSDVGPSGPPPGR